VEGVSPSFHSTSDPVGSPGPAHCIESVATESPVMLVNNAYCWNPLHEDYGRSSHFWKSCTPPEGTKRLA